MWGDISEKLFDKMEKYLEAIGEPIPLMEIPEVAEEELLEKIDKAIEEGKRIQEYFPEMKKFYTGEVLT